MRLYLIQITLNKRTQHETTRLKYTFTGTVKQLPIKLLVTDADTYTRKNKILYCSALYICNMLLR